MSQQGRQLSNTHQQSAHTRRPHAEGHLSAPSNTILLPAAAMHPSIMLALLGRQLLLQQADQVRLSFKQLLELDRVTQDCLGRKDSVCVWGGGWGRKENGGESKMARMHT